MLPEFIDAIKRAPKNQRVVINDVIFYLFATIVIFSNELFNYLPRYGTWYSVLLTFFFATLYQLMTYLEIKDGAISKFKRYVYIKMVLICTAICFIVYLNIYNDMFMDKGEKLIREYFSYLNDNILNKDSVNSEHNRKMYEYHHIATLDRHKKRFPYHDIDSDFHSLYGTTVQQEILHIEKIREDNYIILVRAKEYLMTHDMNKIEYSSEDEKIDEVLKNIEQYFKLESTHPDLANLCRSEMKDVIRDYIQGAGYFLIQGELSPTMLWTIGSAHKLVLTGGDIKTTCRGELTNRIFTYYFITDVKKQTIYSQELTALSPTDV